MAVQQQTGSSHRIIRFGVFEANLRAGELRKNGLKIKLRGQPFEVLAMLLERPGEVVTREELQQRLWKDGIFVDFDHSLNTAVNKIREALSDSAETPRFVETLSRRGYRFIAPVEHCDVEVGVVPTNGRAIANADPSDGSPAEPSAQLSQNQTSVASVLSNPLSPNPPPPLLASNRSQFHAAAILVLLLLGGVLLWWSLRRSTPLREPLLTRLTTDPGLTTDAVISPDGKMIAYASDRGGDNLEIWVKQVSGGDPIRLTYDPADDHQPAFSPDGSQIVFRSERAGGGIYLVSTLGGESRLLAQKGRNPRFSPLNDWIAFWVGPLAGHPLGAQAGKIFLIPPAGGDPKQVDPPGIIEAGCPIWSPNGTHLLFYASDSQKLPVWHSTSDWWVWPLAGGSAVKTGAFAAFAAQNIDLAIPNPVPAPSEWADDQIFFNAKAGHSVSSWHISISPKNWQITGPAHRVTSGSGLDVRPSLARSGLLVFSSLEENADIWGLPIDASEARVKGPPEQLTNDLAADYSPSMSTNGRKLVFTSERSGNADIWMKDLESGTEKQLVASPSREGSPRISPDGSWVSYGTKRPGIRLSIIPAGGGLVRNVSNEPGLSWGWSPDSQFLFFVSRVGAVSVFNLSTGKVSSYLQSSQYPVYHANLTQDGRWITFVTLDTGSSPSRLEVLAARCQGETPPKENDWIKVVSDPYWNDKPRWSPDGNRIYFVSDRDGFACLWSQPVEPETKRPVGPPRLLYHIHGVRRSILNVGYALMDIAVAPDRIVFNLGEITGNIWMTQLPRN